jgi:hypothetical protein
VNPKGEQKQFCKGEISKEFFVGGKAKLAYFGGGKHLFTHNFISSFNVCQFFMDIILVVNNINCTFLSF